jgi:hypothetical protein
MLETHVMLAGKPTCPATWVTRIKYDHPSGGRAPSVQCIFASVVTDAIMGREPWRM